MAVKKNVTTESVQEAALTRCEHCKDSPVAGMVFKRNLESADFYERIGKMVPCSCPSGDAIQAAYQKQKEKADMEAGVTPKAVYSLGA